MERHKFLRIKSDLGNNCWVVSDCLWYLIRMLRKTICSRKANWDTVTRGATLHTTSHSPATPRLTARRPDVAPAPSTPLWSRDWVTPSPSPTHLRIKRGDPTAFRSATPFHLLMSLFFMHLLSLEFICCSRLFTLKICVLSRAPATTQCFNSALHVFSAGINEFVLNICTYLEIVLYS